MANLMCIVVCGYGGLKGISTILKYIVNVVYGENFPSIKTLLKFKKLSTEICNVVKMSVIFLTDIFRSDIGSSHLENHVMFQDLIAFLQSYY